MASLILSVVTKLNASLPAPEPKLAINIRSPGSELSKMSVNPRIDAPA